MKPACCVQTGNISKSQNALLKIVRCGCIGLVKSRIRKAVKIALNEIKGHYAMVLFIFYGGRIVEIGLVL